MQRCDIKTSDPVRYAKVKAEQDRIKNKCSSFMTTSRNCPYCEHQVMKLYYGEHSYLTAKCSKCGEEICFPPISISG